MLGMIANETPFVGQLKGSGCLVKVERYVPCICTAIHAGHSLREDLVELCELSPQERWYEEDPFTDRLIEQQPITLMGLDSRFEFDLNRPKSQCVYYKSAWGKSVWQQPLSTSQRQASQTKHELFYRVYDALVRKLEDKFAQVLVFDIHSYNYKRVANDIKTPVFNVGTRQIDVERWGRIVDHYLALLTTISVSRLEIDAEADAIFEGRGYLIAHTNANFDRTLVLPTETKKVFMDELTGQAFQQILDGLAGELCRVITSTFEYFCHSLVEQDAS